MADEILTSRDAALAFKDTVNDLMKGLYPIIQKHDKSGLKVPDFSTILKSASSGGASITKIFDEGLTPTTKFLFAQAWAKSMDEKFVLEKFVKSTKPQWSVIENGKESEQEAATLKVVDALDIPSGGAKFLQVLYEKKNLLNAGEKKAVLEYFKTCIYYAQIYEELKGEEAKKSKKVK